MKDHPHSLPTSLITSLTTLYAETLLSSQRIRGVAEWAHDHLTFAQTLQRQTFNRMLFHHAEERDGFAKGVLNSIVNDELRALVYETARRWDWRSNPPPFSKYESNVALLCIEEDMAIHDLQARIRQEDARAILPGHATRRSVGPMINLAQVYDFVLHHRQRHLREFEWGSSSPEMLRVLGVAKLARSLGEACDRLAGVS